MPGWVGWCCWEIARHPLSAPGFRRRFIDEFLFPSLLALHSGSQVSSLGCLRVKVVPHSAASQPSVNVFALWQAAGIANPQPTALTTAPPCHLQLTQ